MRVQDFIDWGSFPQIQSPIPAPLVARPRVGRRERLGREPVPLHIGKIRQRARAWIQGNYDTENRAEIKSLATLRMLERFGERMEPEGKASAGETQNKSISAVNGKWRVSQQPPPPDFDKKGRGEGTPANEGGDLGTPPITLVY